MAVLVTSSQSSTQVLEPHRNSKVGTLRVRDRARVAQHLVVTQSIMECNCDGDCQRYLCPGMSTWYDLDTSTNSARLYTTDAAGPPGNALTFACVVEEPDVRVYNSARAQPASGLKSRIRGREAWKTLWGRPSLQLVVNATGTCGSPCECVRVYAGCAWPQVSMEAG